MGRDGRETDVPVRVEKMGRRDRGRFEDDEDTVVDYTKRPKNNRKENSLDAHRRRAETEGPTNETLTIETKIEDFTDQVDERVAEFSEFPPEVDAAENPEAQGLIQRVQEAGETFHTSVEEVSGVTEEAPQTAEPAISDVPKPPKSPEVPLTPEPEPNPRKPLLEKSELILHDIAARLEVTQPGIDHAPFIAALRKKIEAGDFETPTEYLITQGDQQITESARSPRDEFFALLDDVSTQADLEEKAQPAEKNAFAEKAEAIQSTIELMDGLSPEAPQPETTEVGAKENKEETLEDLRKDYAQALSNRGKFFNPSSQQIIDETGSRYEEAVKAALHDSFLKKAEGLDLNIPEQRQRFMELSAEGVVESMQEREQLLEAMNEMSKGKFPKFKEYWRSHPKLRLAVGLGLGAGAAVMAATGNIPAAAGFMYGRAAMSATSTTMTSEAAFNLARKKWGATKERSDAEINLMTVDDIDVLEELHAAHTIEATMTGVKRGEETTFLGKAKGKISETSERIDAKLTELRKQEYLSEMKIRKQEGATDEELVSQHMFEYLNQQEIRGHKQLQKRQDRVRWQNIAKWTGATLAGATVGWLIGSKAEAMSEGAKTAKEVAKEQATDAGEHTEPEAVDVEEAAKETTLPESTPGSQEFIGPLTADQAAAQVAETTGQAAEAATTAASAIETVEKGDTVWGLLKHQLNERLGEKFTSLNEAQQTHLIDQFKDQVTEHPEQFGLKNPDVISVGDKIDFSALFPDEKTVLEALGKSTSLSEHAMESIVEHNKALREAAQAAVEQVTDDAPEQVAAEDVASINPEDWKFKTDLPNEAVESDSAGDAAQVNPETAVPSEEAVSSGTETVLEQATPPEDLEKLRELATDKHEVIMLEKSIKPLEKIGDITETLPDNTISRMADLTIQDYMKGAAYKKIEVMEGVSSKTAKAFVENVKDLVKHVDKLRDVKVNREWTLGALSKAVVLAEKAK